MIQALLQVYRVEGNRKQLIPVLFRPLRWNWKGGHSPKKRRIYKFFNIGKFERKGHLNFIEVEGFL